MAVWLPLLKASLPFVTQIVSSKLPAFTSKSPVEKSDEVVPRQIAELQSAATRNAEAIKALATQLQTALEGMDAGAQTLQRELSTLRWLAGAALLTALLALAALAVLLAR